MRNTIRYPHCSKYGWTHPSTPTRQRYGWRNVCAMSRVSGDHDDRTSGDASNPRSWPVRRTESFGGVPVRTTAGRPEVALIRPRSEDAKVVWALPKGAKDEG